MMIIKNTVTAIAIHSHLEDLGGLGASFSAVIKVD